MASENRADDEVVIAYLLGAAPPQDVERLDELSIADDEFASRLGAVENDLVDAYVRGMLSGVRLERFKEFYLASPRRRQKVAFAKALQAKTDRGAPKRFHLPAWSMAAAACLALIAAAVQLSNFSRPRPRSVPQSPAQAQASPPAQPAAPTPAPLQAMPASAFVLLPQLRSAGEIPALLLPPGTNQAQFYLELESDDFTGYRVALRDPATDRILWRSGPLRSAATGRASAVPVTVPASLLDARSYTLELSGVGANGPPELVAGYTFRVTK